MPIDTIVVELVQKSQTMFMCTALFVFTIVWLWQSNTAIFWPVALAAICGRGNFLQFSCPEPSVDRDGLKVRTVTAFEVTHTTTCPDVFYLKFQDEKLLNKIIHTVNGKLVNEKVGK